MERKPFFWHIFPLFLVLTVAACACIVFFAISSFKAFYLDQTVLKLKQRAVLLEEPFSRFISDTSVDIDSVCKALGSKIDTRITAILPGGRVLGDTYEDPDSMDSHSDRPEFITALKGDTGVSTRFSNTVKRTMMYVAIPLKDEGRTGAIIRASVKTVDIADTVSTISSQIFMAGIIVILIVVFVSIELSRRLSSPLQLLKKGAKQIAEGNFDTRLEPGNVMETAQLAETMNQMAVQLEGWIKKITSQRNEQSAIISSMVEGVIAVDKNEHIIMINQAAASMLKVDPGKVKGRWIQESIRNAELQKYIKKMLKDPAASEKTTEITTLLSENNEITVEVNGSVLKGATSSEEEKGICIVLHDITEIKRLERVRSDFVASVSHELRTPLTAIKGFIETLMDGAIDNPRERMRFFRIIQNHTNRLNAIICDLLTLSRLEKSNTESDIEFEETSLKAVINDAVRVCYDNARKESIDIIVEGDLNNKAYVNSSLFQQAVINLIDNAVKYSGSGKDVRIECAREKDNVTISVSDEGPGIEPKHLPRLFERFYRIDKARSRKMGGTGLGLSIVKHIMNVHNGHITVDSKPGKGSRFTLYLPVKKT